MKNENFANSDKYFYIDDVSLTQGNYEKVGQTDYYPGGMTMPNRNVQGDYRYAYQGQEKDSETGKEAFQLRLYDSRINRWLTTDPAGQYHSPYMAMGNNPINGTDPDGAFWEELGNWFSGNGWNSNAALDFQAGGGTLAEWNGNKFTGYRRGYDDREGASIREFRAVDDYGGHVINPIVNFPIDFAGGVKDFHDEYSTMKNRNFKFSDKYFHSKANFKATLRGPGGEYAAEKLSNLREITDQRFKGDSKQSSLEDQEANKYGRERAKHYKLHGLDEIDINFKEAIPSFRPKYKGFPYDL
jgi:RHS repeat-associated protein